MKSTANTLGVASYIFPPLLLLAVPADVAADSMLEADKKERLEAQKQSDLAQAQRRQQTAQIETSMRLQRQNQLEQLTRHFPDDCKFSYTDDGQILYSLDDLCQEYYANLFGDDHEFK